MRRLGARWYVFGAQAVAVWARPRTTKDVDITVRLERSTHDLVEELQREGFRLRVHDVDDFVARTRVLPFTHTSGLDLDVVLSGSGLEDEFLDRSRPLEIAGEAIRFIDPSDLVVSKILSGRPKDIEDVRAILEARREDIDVARVRVLLRSLEASLSQSDLSPAFEGLLHTRDIRPKQK